MRCEVALLPKEDQNKLAGYCVFFLCQVMAAYQIFAFISLLFVQVFAEADGCLPTECRKGRKGKPGKEGAYGPPGLPGTQGENGLSGPIGPLSTDVYADLFSVDTPIVVPNNSLFFFASNTLSSDFVVTTSDTGTLITFSRPGIYIVSYVLSQQFAQIDPVSLVLVLDSEEVPFSQYSKLNSANQIVGQALVNVSTAGSVLSLRNNSNFILIQLPLVYAQIASLNIVRYGEPGLNFS